MRGGSQIFQQHPQQQLQLQLSSAVDDAVYDAVDDAVDDGDGGGLGGAISLRTRARVSLVEVPIERLEQMLNEEWCNQEEEMAYDEVEYEAFLRVSAWGGSWG